MWSTSETKSLCRRGSYVSAACLQVCTGSVLCVHVARPTTLTRTSLRRPGSLVHSFIVPAYPAPRPPPPTHTQTDMARCLLPALAVYVTDFSCVYSTSGWPTTDDCQLSITPILSQSGIPAFEPHDQRIFLSARILSFFFRLFLRFCFDIRC